MNKFHFEADIAVIPIIASHWDNNIESARVYYQNDKAILLYGDLRGQLLAELFNEILLMNHFEHAHPENKLMQNLEKNGFLKDISGTLNGKRVELYSAVQKHTNKIIQSAIIDVTKRFIDPLSGIPGRDLFFDRLDSELFRAKREKSEIHICFVDLDGFKQTNDLYGHKAGDDVITEVGRRLRNVIRRHEAVSRFGGDEFVIMLSDPKVDSLHFSEKKLIPALNLPYNSGTHTIDFIGASVGIACAPLHTFNPDKLINHADDAMYIAKERGKNQAVIFEHGMESMKKR